LVSTIILLFSDSNGASTDESFQAEPEPMALGFQSSAAPFGR
jgi:hypothetical protein